MANRRFIFETSCRMLVYIVHWDSIITIRAKHFLIFNVDRNQWFLLSWLPNRSFFLLSFALTKLLRSNSATVEWDQVLIVVWFQLTGSLDLIDLIWLTIFIKSTCVLQWADHKWFLLYCSWLSSLIIAQVVDVLAKQAWVVRMIWLEHLRFYFWVSLWIL